jgi:hypothetical protein
VSRRTGGAVHGALALVLAATGCGLLDDPEDGGRSAERSRDIETRFTKIAPQGFIDLSLDLTNPTDRPLVVSGRLVALDATGAELPSVQVTGVFASEQGRLVLMPGVNVDFVQLDGPGAEKVEDVVLEDQKSRPVDVAAAAQVVDLVPLDAKGVELEYDTTAVAARLDNPNDVPVEVRVVLLALGYPEEGAPQEAIQVEDVTQVDVPALGSTNVPLDAATRKLLRRLGGVSFVTLRAVFSPPA